MFNANNVWNDPVFVTDGFIAESTLVARPILNLDDELEADEGSLAVLLQLLPDQQIRSGGCLLSRWSWLICKCERKFVILLKLYPPISNVKQVNVKRM